MGLMLNNQPIKGEVHLGKQTIGKMYYNSELVYERHVKSGTVLWEGKTTAGGGGSAEIPLSGIDANSRLKGLVIFYNDMQLGKKQISLTSIQLKNGFSVEEGNRAVFYVIKPIASNILNVTTIYGSNYIYKITAL